MTNYVKKEIVIEEGSNKAKLTIEEGHDPEVAIQQKQLKVQDLCPKTHTEKRFFCEVCGKGLLTLRNFKEHMARHGDEKNYKCDQCDKAFNIKRDLDKHKINTHATEKPFQCEVCPKSFASSTTLRLHSKGHDESSFRFRCETCGKRLLTLRNFKEHMVRHADERNHRCDQCDKACKTKRDLEKHKINMHATERPFRCEVCSKSFATLKFLVTHSKIHDKVNCFPFTCGVCGKRFLTPYKVRVHMVRHRGERNVKCDRCESKFKNQRTLGVHKRRSHNLEERPRKCDECSEAFGTPFKLNSHKIFAHHDGRKFCCKICGFWFKTLGERTKHLKSHLRGKAFACGQCDKKYKHKYGLAIHEKKAHAAERRFRCEACSKSFATGDLLRTHRKIHDESKSFRFGCELCAKRFLTPYKLKVHMVSHGDEMGFLAQLAKPEVFNLPSTHHIEERPHKCDHCSNSYLTKGRLASHKATAHGLPRHFPCGVCGKTFPRSWKLKQHLVCHSDEKKFKCDRCDKTFKWQSLLTVHKRGAHATEENPHKCNRCSESFKTRYKLYTHKTLAHEKGKTFFCEMCNGSFISSTFLRVHMKSHSNERNFGCDGCDKTYKYKNDLVKHKIKAHATGDIVKKMSCNVCGKQFPRSTYLKTHLMSHSDERNFGCDQCDKKYKYKKDLVYHKGNAHATAERIGEVKVEPIVIYDSETNRQVIKEEPENLDMEEG